MTLPKLNRKNVYILPTRYGFLFIFILVVLLLDAMNHNNNLEFLYVFLLAGILFVSIFHTYRNLMGLRIVSGRANPVFAGEKAVFEMRARSSFRPRSAVRFSFGPEDETTVDLPGAQGTRIHMSVTAPERGIFDPGALSIFTCFPLGLFKSWSKVDTGASCMVYPRPLAGPFSPLQGEDSSGHTGKTPGPGVDDFKGLRLFRPGDSRQHIYWKAFSRGRGLLTKEFMGAAGSAIMLDWEGLSTPDVEIKLSRLCHMVLIAHGLNLPYGLKLPGTAIGPSKGAGHKHECLQALALFAPPSNKPDKTHHETC
ncbi:MAG: DUF58 domain-containing protein [Desulfobacterales bacterium]|nr:DUF58 domain-containing protein [Desulfobacterales bacterium]